MGSMAVRLRFTLLCILQLSLVFSAVGQFEKNYDYSNLQSRVEQQFYMSHRINKSSPAVQVLRDLQPESVIKANINRNLHFVNDREISESECERQLTAFFNGVEQFEEWALKMVDSSSKIPQGILTGNLKDLGVYDECVSVKVEKEEVIRGRHCMYSLLIEEASTGASLTPTFSICLPAACGAEYAAELIQSAVNITLDNLADFDVDIGVKSVTCSAVDPEPWSVGGIVTLVVLSLYLAFLVGCTVCDVFFKGSYPWDNKVLDELSKFSLYRNAKRILSTKIPRDNLPAIQGIRFFSMGWVVLGHVYYVQMFGVVSNGLDTAKWLKSWSALYIVIAPFTVDTFFVISGFLISYLFIKEMAKGRKFNPIMFYVHRYLRITPALAALLVITIYIFPRIGSGAIWETNMKIQEEFCSKNWWAILLYVQNYVNTEYLMCLGHAWYLAADMQFFWISPLIVYPLAKKPKIGLIILSALVIASCIVPPVILAKHEYSGSVVLSSNTTNSGNTMRYYYIVSHTRAGPWLMGVFMGYKLAVMKNQKLKRKSVIFGWILAVLAFAFGFFTFRVFQVDGYEYNVYWEVFYAAFARHIWAFGVCWLIYSSILGYGGIIGQFLSLPIFMPLGRISYCIYLVHFIIQLMKVSAIRLPLYFDNFIMLNLFFSDFVLCIVVGFIFSVVFESPFMVLEKMILGRKKRDDQNNLTKNSQDARVTVGVYNHGYQHDNGQNFVDKK